MLTPAKQLVPRPLPHESKHWHNDDVNCVKITLDGELIASAGDSSFRLTISVGLVLLTLMIQDPITELLYRKFLMAA